LEGGKVEARVCLLQFAKRFRLQISRTGSLPAMDYIALVGAVSFSTANHEEEDNGDYERDTDKGVLNAESDQEVDEDS
jgi:hypothetical protein